MENKNIPEACPMRSNKRLLILSLLVSSWFAVVVCDASEAAHDHGSAEGSLSAEGSARAGAALSAARGGNWSDASTWSGGVVPKAGDSVTIGAGMIVVLDV